MTPGTESDDFEQPTMGCPRCRKVYDDFDGFGVVYCDPKSGGCGFCQHLSRTGPTFACDYCGAPAPEEST